ncbi:zinc finger BED domain-containing protein RICESLEEPER 1-like isoform X1 [Aphis craccivora]|uniref:Zinc finger BED domain-containing protein RICESLEEPER 1-like isoform X1 n=1 Tax=Aphis craccivora TaxID=307492 RepID=A0A6G0W6T7_APHCR|nr:zinc finger BED domain-containing protein RICESLEEPER 1-like isoform X1 [Aphis craccivora]
MGRVPKSIIGTYFFYDKAENCSTCKTCSSKIKSKDPNVPVKKTNVDLYQFLKPSVKVKTDMKTLINACVELVTVNGLPYSMLDDSGFQNIINPILCGIQNSVVLNSSSIKKYVHLESQLLINQISEDIAFKLVSLKVDAVTRCNRAFLGINVQYIVNGCIKLRSIGLVELTESHTGVYLKDIILKVIKKFNIQPQHLYTITSDNGANMLKAVSLIEKETLQIPADEIDDNIIENDTGPENRLETSSDESDIDDISNSIDPDSTSQILNENQIFELLNENIDIQFEQSERIINDVELQEIGYTSIFTNIRCVAHTLQLAVLDSLKDNTIQKLLNKEKLKTPISDCLTRWNSTYDMLERLQYLKNFIQNMSVNDKTLKKVALSYHDWQQVETISKALLPAKVCSKKLQTEQLTMTDFNGAWIFCKIQTNAMNSDFSNKLVQLMTNREKIILNNQVLLAAIFLDPRYNITLSREQSATAIQHLTNIWICLKKIELNNQVVNTLSPECHQNTSDSLNPTDPIDDLEIYLRSKANNESTSSDFGSLSNSQTETIGTKIETLLKSFSIEEKRLCHKINILQFWKSKKLVYPELFELSNIVFSVPASQVSVERLFSGLKFVLSPSRCNISAKNLENQLLVRTNMLFEKNKNLQGASK